MSTEIQELKSALEQVQNFDVNQLPREKDFGEQAGFKDSVPPAKKLVEIFKRVPSSAIEDYPTDTQNTLKQYAQNCSAIFNRIVSFHHNQGDVMQFREQIKQELHNTYQTYFNFLIPLIGYGGTNDRNASEIVTKLIKQIENVNLETNVLNEKGAGLDKRSYLGLANGKKALQDKHL